MRCSNRSTNSDFRKAKLFRASTNDIRIISCAAPHSQTTINSLSQRTPISSSVTRKPPLGVLCVKKAASGVPDAAVSNNALANGLKGKIYTCASHTEIVFRPIDEIPAEITDPADMRGETDFHAAAHLADSLCLAICMTNCLENVETLAPLVNKPFANKPIDRPLAATKDGAGAAKKVGRKAGARDRITQCEGAQHRADRVALVMNATRKDSVTEDRKSVV